MPEFRDFPVRRAAEAVCSIIRCMRSSLWSIIVAVLGSACAISAGEWPCWRGPAHDGIVPAEPLLTDWPADGPPVLWRASVGTGFSSVVVSAGKAYTLGNRDAADVLVCFDAIQGHEVWRQSYPAELDPNLFEGGPTATPTVAGRDVFTFSRQGLAACWEADSGAERWRVDVPRTCGVDVPGWGFSGSPVVDGDRVLLNAGSAGVALNRRTGEVLWQSDNSDTAAYATPRIAELGGRSLALILSGKALHAVDPASGVEQWSHRWITRYGVNAADPLVRGHELWLTSGYAKGASLVRVTEAGATEVWRNRELRNQMSPGVILDRHVYAVDGDENEDRVLRCLDFESGAPCWDHAGLGSATLIASGSILVILSDTGELVLAEASPEAFRPLARARVLSGKCWTPPALADGRLYCRNAAGEVVCLNLRPAQ